jgi:uncharacterized protein with beta-barrel porin domain
LFGLKAAFAPDPIGGPAPMRGFGDTLRAGLVAGYVRSDVDVAARASSAGIDSVQLGAYAAGGSAPSTCAAAPLVVRQHRYQPRHLLPDFTDKTKASFHGNVGRCSARSATAWRSFVSRSSRSPGWPYVHLRDGSFLESGGLRRFGSQSAQDNTAIPGSACALHRGAAGQWHRWCRVARCNGSMPSAT